MDEIREKLVYINDSVNIKIAKIRFDWKKRTFTIANRKKASSLTKTTANRILICFEIFFFGKSLYGQFYFQQRTRPPRSKSGLSQSSETDLLIRVNGCLDLLFWIPVIFYLWVYLRIRSMFRYQNQLRNWKLTSRERERLKISQKMI